MSFIIRKAAPEDAYDYAACHIASWQSAYRGILPDEYLDNMGAQTEQRAERFEQELIKPSCVYYIAVYEGRVVGKLVLGTSRDDDKHSAGEIIAIYLLEKFWGRSYGRKMMDFALTSLRKQGHHEVILWVLEDNHRARRFYEKCGFACDGTRKSITIVKPLTELRYTLTL